MVPGAVRAAGIHYVHSVNHLGAVEVRVSVKRDFAVVLLGFFDQLLKTCMHILIMTVAAEDLVAANGHDLL